MIVTGQRSIIVVGPDRVGKTTTVANLSRLTGMPAFKAPSEKQIFREGGRQSLAFDYTLTHFLGQTGYRFISDRGYPCEEAYSRVFGRDTDRELLKRIDEMHANLGTVIVYLYSSDIPEEEDDIVPKDRYWDIVESYNQFIEKTACRVVSWNTLNMLRAFRLGGDISNHVAENILEEAFR